MRFSLIALAAAQLLATSLPTLAHGDAPHPTCKKGYVLTDAHKCVKAP